MKLAGITLKNNLVLAPLSGFTDIPFRLLCRKHGASFAYIPLVSAEAVLRDNELTKEALIQHAKDSPLGIQLFGNDPSKLSEAAKKIEDETRCDLIDINLGCPSYVIGRQGCGAELLKKPELIEKIIKKVSSSISIPLTAKIRILRDKKKTLAIAKMIQDAGASVLTVHGRTLKQGYSGSSDSQMISAVREHLDIPVIASGDVRDHDSAKRVQKETGCKLLMIGRAALGNPRIFSQIENKSSFTDEKKTKLEDFIEYSKLFKKLGYSEFNKLKNQCMTFCSGFEGCVDMRRKITMIKKEKELMSFVKKSIS